MDTPTRDAVVTLRDVTEENLRSVMKLEVAESQRSYVAPNSWSIAEHAYTTEAWLQAVYADETPVGLVLLSERASVPRFYLWRFMIDRRHQGLGFGAAAMQHVFDRVRSFPEGHELFLTYVPGDTGPREFYARLGFVDTGIVHEGEHEMRIEFA